MNDYRNCLNCCNKYIDYFDTECQCYVCLFNKQVLSLYDEDSKMNFNSCLNHRYYGEKYPFESLIKVIIEPPITLPF